MKVKNTGVDMVFNILSWVISIALLIITIYPLYFVLVASISSAQDISNGSVWLFPKNLSLKGYKTIFGYARLWLGYRNTIFYTVLGTLINLAMMIPAGYALSRGDYPLRKPLIAFFTVTLFLSGGLMPTYNVIRSLKMLDTVWALVLPGAINVFYLIIIRTFFMTSIPGELRDAAQIDGCGDIRYFFSIVMPLSFAIIAVIGLYCAVGHWNSYFNALIYIRNDKMIPLQLVLRELLIQNSSNVTSAMDINAMEMVKLRELIKYCMIVVSTLPVMLIYPFIQKYFMQGTMIGSLKE